MNRIFQVVFVDDSTPDVSLPFNLRYKSGAEDGTYTAIPGANAKTYAPADDVNYYLKVKITPAAASGITAGTAVLSSPTVLISAPPVF